MADSRFTAVTLAGGPLEADFREAGYQVPNKAYLPVAGELMLVRVLRALRAARSIGQIRCVTPASAVQTAPQVLGLSDAIIEPGGDLISSMLAGFDGLPEDERIIVSATDMPLLTGDAVDAFANLVVQTPCDVGYGFVERSVHDARYPGVRHTWVHLREGTFCGAGISVVRAGAARRMEPILRDLIAARKSPAKLAAIFSPMVVLKIVTGRLDVAELERRATQLTGFVCRGIVSPDPETAVNVDRLEDLRTTEALLLRPADAFRTPR